MQNYIILDNQHVNFSWKWIKHDKLKTNQNQTRDRGDLGSQMQINAMATNLIPELLSQSYDVSTGAPVVDSKNNIISGHGRISAIAMAFYNEQYIGGYENYIKYKNYLHDNILALDDYYTDDLMILCRVIDTKYNTAKYIHSANTTTLSYTPFELAKINAQRLKSTVNDFVCNMPLLEQAQYFTNGMLNNKAYSDYNSAKIVKALPNCQILADYINYPNPDYKNVISALIDNIDTIIDMQQNNIQLFNNLTLALDKFLQIKQNDGCIDDFLLQLDIFDSNVNSADFSNLLSIFWHNNKSAKKLAIELSTYFYNSTVTDLFAEESQQEIKEVQTTIIPRDWQQNTLDHIEKNLAANNTRLLISAPTGAGKAFLLMFIARQQINNNKRVLLLVDRVKLLSQLCESATQFRLNYNVINGTTKEQENKPLTIATIQTFYKMETPPPFDTILIDECHTVYQHTIEHMKDLNTVFIGCTATPTTKGLKRHYPVLINEITQIQLEQDNILTPLVVDQQKYIDMTGAIVQAGEWIPREITERCQSAFDDWIMQSIEENLAKHNHAIAFCASIEHCEALKARLKQINVTGAIYTSAQDKAERVEILDNYNNGNTHVLITVATLSKGFDCKLIDLIIDLRPLRQSLAEYIQMIGRGTRIHKNKNTCKILDFTGNWYRFGKDVLEMRSNGVKSTYNATWNDLDQIVLTHGVNRSKAAKIAFEESKEGKRIKQNIEKAKNEILALKKFCTMKVQKRFLDKSTPAPTNFFGKLFRFFK